MSSTDVREVARVEIKKALSPYFLEYRYDDGRTDVEHLDEAVQAVLDNVSRLLQNSAVPQKKLGATVMTESASMRTGKDGLPGIKPRTF